MAENETQAEPVVTFNGVASDGSEHAPMLANQAANERADALAREQARQLGLSEEMIDRLIG